MSLSTMLWQTSTDGSTWTDQKTPSTYKIDWEDLDLDSYRSVVTGNLIRNVIRRRWAKVSMSWRLLNYDQTQFLLSSVNQDTVYFRFKTPAFGTDRWITFIGYVSKMSAEMLEGQRGFAVSFNVIQKEGASWQ